MRGLIVCTALALVTVASAPRPDRPRPAHALLRDIVDTPPSGDRDRVRGSLTDPWRPWPPGEMPILPRAAVGAPLDLVGPTVVLYLAVPEDTIPAGAALRARYRELAARGAELTAALDAVDIRLVVTRAPHVVIRDPRWDGTTVYPLGDSLAHVWLFTPGTAPVEADVRSSSGALIQTLRDLTQRDYRSRPI